MREKNYEYIKWKNSVLKRDNHMCQLCGIDDKDCTLHCHHIEKYADNEDLRYDVNNGITLCYICHNNIYNKEERYARIFKEILKNPIWIKCRDEKIMDINIDYENYKNLDENFISVPNDLFKVITSGNQYLVYSYLCFRYNQDYGYAFPSLKTIAKDCNISVSTVQRCIKELENLKLIVVLKFDEKDNKYVNNIYKIFYPIIHEEKEIYEIPQLTEEQMKQLEDIEDKIYEIIEDEENDDNEDK